MDKKYHLTRDQVHGVVKSKKAYPRHQKIKNLAYLPVARTTGLCPKILSIFAKANIESKVTNNELPAQSMSSKIISNVRG